MIGILTLPLCAWAFGRLARFMFPIPELFTIAALIFLLDDSFQIYGGNVKSTMAGEFSFSIALSLAILGLGLFARGLETGKHRAITAVVLALAVLSHGIVAIFVLVAVVLMALVWMDKTRFIYTITTMVPMALLTAFWIIPFTSGTAYMTDMKYGKRPEGANDSYWKMFFPLDIAFDRIIFVLALIGFIGSIRRRHLTGAWMGICIIALMVLTRFAENSLPIIGLLWNPRILPFIYLLRYMLMMVGVVEVIRGVGVARSHVRASVTRCRQGAPVRSHRGIRGAAHATIDGHRRRRRRVRHAHRRAADLRRRVPGQLLRQHHQGRALRAQPSVSATASWCSTRTAAPTSAAWPTAGPGTTSRATRARPRTASTAKLIDDMSSIGADPNFGCGRALWENNGDNGRYGTTMALMLLPHWTDGCIGSSEGLFFEASGTTPYHFLTAAAMSSHSSNPVRQLRYDDNQPELGVPYMQKLGIRYYMAWTDLAVEKADQTPGLTPIMESGPWHIYEVADTDFVVPLTTQPVVVNHRDGDQRERWLELGTSWFQNPSEWTAMPTDDGPADWQRIDAVVDESRVQPNTRRRRRARAADRARHAAHRQRVERRDGQRDGELRRRPGRCSRARQGQLLPQLGGDRCGRAVPHRTQPDGGGADLEPRRDSSTRRTSTDYIAYALTILGIILLFVFARFVPIRHRSPAPVHGHGRRFVRGAGRRLRRRVPPSTSRCSLRRQRVRPAVPPPLPPRSTVRAARRSARLDHRPPTRRRPTASLVAGPTGMGCWKMTIHPDSVLCRHDRH